MIKIKKFHRVTRKPSDCKKKKKRLPVKRIAVQEAHASVSALLLKHDIILQQKIYGEGIVRIGPTTIPQLENTAKFLSLLIEKSCIQEVGMPLQHNYKMRSLVLFIKPTNPEATLLIASTFRASEFSYHITIFDVKTPAQKARENQKEKTQVEENHKKTDLLKYKKQSKSKAKVAEKDTFIQNVAKKCRLFCFVFFGIPIAYLLFFLTQ